MANYTPYFPQQFSAYPQPQESAQTAPPQATPYGHPIAAIGTARLDSIAAEANAHKSYVLMTAVIEGIMIFIFGIMYCVDGAWSGVLPNPVLITIFLLCWTGYCVASVTSANHHTDSVRKIAGYAAICNVACGLGAFVLTAYELGVCVSSSTSLTTLPMSTATCQTYLSVLQMLLSLAIFGMGIVGVGLFWWRAIDYELHAMVLGFRHVETVLKRAFDGDRQKST